MSSEFDFDQKISYKINKFQIRIIRYQLHFEIISLFLC